MKVHAMKGISVLVTTLLVGVLSYTPCDVQDEFNVVMCESATCKLCDEEWCINKCIAFQETYNLCRCVDWPCERSCYQSRFGKPCPPEGPECVDPTTTTPPPPPKALKEEVAAANEEIEEANEAAEEAEKEREEAIKLQKEQEKLKKEQEEAKRKAAEAEKAAKKAADEKAKKEAEAAAKKEQERLDKIVAERKKAEAAAKKAAEEAKKAAEEAERQKKQAEEAMKAAEEEAKRLAEEKEKKAAQMKKEIMADGDVSDEEMEEIEEMEEELEEDDEWEFQWDDEFDEGNNHEYAYDDEWGALTFISKRPPSWTPQPHGKHKHGKGKKKAKRVIGHRLKTQAPPGGVSTISIGHDTETAKSAVLQKGAHGGSSYVDDTGSVYVQSGSPTALNPVARRKQLGGAQMAGIFAGKVGSRNSVLSCWLGP